MKIKDFIPSTFLPSESTKDEDLRAFRTITVMLTLIQSSASRLPSEAGLIATGGGNRAKELSVLDALSAVLVRDQEITAVVGRQYNGSGLEVFASVIYPSKAQPLVQPGVSNQRSLWESIFDFTVAINPRTDPINNRFDSLTNKSTFPLFGDYEDIIPKDLVSAAAAKENVLGIYLESHW